MSLLILTPLIAANTGFVLLVLSLYEAVVIALLLTFLLGVFPGNIAGVLWLRSRIETLLVAILTVALMYLYASY